jgi:hypothetical protein
MDSYRFAKKFQNEHKKVGPAAAAGALNRAGYRTERGALYQAASVRSLLADETRATNISAPARSAIPAKARTAMAAAPAAVAASADGVAYVYRVVLLERRALAFRFASLADALAAVGDDEAVLVTGRAALASWAAEHGAPELCIHIAPAGDDE